jgi:hypothetical protein
VLDALSAGIACDEPHPAQAMSKLSADARGSE